MDLRIERGQALVDGHFVDTTIHATGDDGTILAVGSEARAGRRIDARASWCFRASSTFTATPSSAR